MYAHMQLWNHCDSAFLQVAMEHVHGSAVRNNKCFHMVIQMSQDARSCDASVHDVGNYTKCICVMLISISMAAFSGQIWLDSFWLHFQNSVSLVLPHMFRAYLDSAFMKTFQLKLKKSENVIFGAILNLISFFILFMIYLIRIIAELDREDKIDIPDCYTTESSIEINNHRGVPSFILTLA